jgi:hypothetical protein
MFAPLIITAPTIIAIMYTVPTVGMKPYPTAIILITWLRGIFITRTMAIATITAASTWLNGPKYHHQLHTQFDTPELLFTIVIVYRKE